MSLFGLGGTDTNDFNALMEFPTYERWTSIIGGIIQRREPIERRWRKLYNDFRGEQIVDGSDDEIIVNVTFGNTKVVESVMYYQDPYFRIRPARDVALAPRAALLEELLNTFWYKLKVGVQVKLAILDATITGLGHVLVGHADYHEVNPNKRGSLYVRRRSPLDVYTEDDLANMSDATFWVTRGLYSVRWLEKVFGKKLTWKPDTDSKVFMRRGMANRYSTQATIYEVIDLVTNKIYWLSPQHRKIIYETGNPYEYYKDTPYCTLAFIPDPERMLPISPNGIVEGQQDELNKIRTQQQRHRKRFNRRYLAQEKAIDADELAKIEAGEDGTIAFCKGNPNNVIVPIQDAPLDPASTQMYQQDIKGDMREILGINEYLRASAIPRTKTAQEASMIQQGSSVRTQNLSSYLETFLVDIAKRMVAVIQNEYDGIQELVKERSLGQYDARQWTKEDVAGDFDIEINLGSTLPPQPIPYEQLQQSPLLGAAPGNEMGAPQQASGAGQGGGGQF